VKVTPNPTGVTVPNLDTSGLSPVNLLQVTVQRTVNTTLLQLLGPSTATIQATGIAAIVTVTSPVPIIITHPTNSATLKGNGSITIRICGGPQRSIQINSSNTATQAVAGGSNSVDLSKAGPKDPGDCSTGTGADFGDFGGPGASLFTLSLGSTGHYIQPASPIDDPLANVPVPPKPAAATPILGIAAGASKPISTTYVSSGSVTCPSGASPGGCDFFTPGDYPSGITASGSKNYAPYFFPGIYQTDSNGFQDGPNGSMQMYPGANSDTSANGTGAGMLVYNTGTGIFKVGSNGGASLVGSDSTSNYKGILLFQDRSAPAHTQKNTDDHIIGGGGALALTGTIYIHNKPSVMTASHYQLVQLQGGGGSNTLIKGQFLQTSRNQLLYLLAQQIFFGIARFIRSR